MRRKYYVYVMTFFVSAPFSALMSFIGIVRNVGLSSDTLTRWFMTWITMLPIAYIAALLIVPTAKMLTDKLPWR
jgi:Protein of unknown function (DUF2798)